MAEKSTVFEAFTPSGSTINEKVRGTIQEVLNKLSSLGMKGKQVIFYSDDGTNAECMFCRKR